MINKMRDISLNEYATAAEATAQLKAFIQYTQIKEPKTDLGWQVVTIWKDFVAFWMQKNLNYAEKKKASIIEKLNENRQVVARKEAERPQMKRREQER